MDSSDGRLQITLLEERSGGTFARVYLAEAVGAGGIQRLIAVKVLREQWADSQEFVNRTKDEARMLARLRHPNIVRVEDLANLDGQLAMVMEFVDGVDLQQLQERLKERRQSLPPRTVYEIMGKVASALDAAWRKAPLGELSPINIVHRDVKPSNVMITADGEVKVLDFGTARGQFEERAAETSMFRFGSLKYMSPERREGGRGDHAGDVYSMGLMLMELLQGSWLGMLPEGKDHAPAIAAAAQALRTTGMSAPDWDAAARKVMRQMCADRPDQRPSAEVVTRLMRAFAEQAEGGALETWCANVVPELSEAIKPTTRGELAGRRLEIGSAPKPEAPLAAPPPPAEVPRTEAPPPPEAPAPTLAPEPSAFGSPEPSAFDAPSAPFHRGGLEAQALPIGMGNDEATQILGVAPEPPPLGDDATQILGVLPDFDDIDPPPPPAPGAPSSNPFAAPPPPAPSFGAPGQAFAPPPPPQMAIEDGAETRILPAGTPLLDEDVTRPPQAAPSPPPVNSPVLSAAPKQAPPSLEIQGPVAEDKPEEAPKKKSGCFKFLVVVLVLTVLCGGVGVLARVAMGLLSGATVEGPTEVTPPVATEGPANGDAPDAPPTEVETPEVVEGGLALTVGLADETMQWVKLIDSAGKTVKKGKSEGLDMNVPPGDYTLSVKVVGRSAVSTDLTLSEPLSLQCAPTKEGAVICDGGAEPLTLVAD